jgi:drug/metabolite transporter (DMT)-like permease
VLAIFALAVARAGAVRAGRMKQGRPPMQSDSLRLGATLMCVAMFMAACVDVAVKAVAGSYGTPQIVLLRIVLSLPLVLVFCQLQGGLRSLLTPRWGWQCYRGLLAAGANFGFFYSLSQLPLLTAVLLAYVAPVLIVLLARPLLGEHIGPNRWLGVVVAVSGVLLMLGPGAPRIDPGEPLSGPALGALAVLASALCWALLSLSNRQLATRETPAVMLFYTLPISGVLAALGTAGDWVTPAAGDWLWFLLAGCCGGAIHFGIVLAYRYAPAGAIAPLEYTTLIWAALAAYLLFGEVPNTSALAGGSAILAGGYLALRARS